MFLLLLFFLIFWNFYERVGEIGEDSEFDGERVFLKKYLF